MAEVIDLLSDSSDDEANVLSNGNGPQIISLLDDDELTRTNNSRKNKTDEYSSDSDYSLSQFKESGLSRKTEKKQFKKKSNVEQMKSLASDTIVPAAITKSVPTKTGLAVLNDITTPSQNVARKKPIFNPYLKTKKVTPLTETLAARTDPSTFCPTSLTTTNAKTYPDLRARISLCLWKYARTLTSDSHNGAELDQTIKKINEVALTDYPIRSLEEYISRFRKHSGGVGDTRNVLKSLKDQLEKGGWSRSSTLTPVNANIGDQYFTIAEACLVACYAKVQQNTARSKGNLDDLQARLSDKDNWISLAWLLPQIDQRLHPSCPSRMMIARENEPDSAVDFYTSRSTLSAEYKQIEKLKSTSNGSLKPHTVRGRPWYELTPLGYETAKRLKNRMYPSPHGPYRTSNVVDNSKYSDIVLGMDFREGGGGTKVLHNMCNKLDWTKLPYFVAPLTIGDYVFFHKDKLLPLLVERKSVQDVAQSIHDGRWQRQKQRMYHGQFAFGYRSCRLAYIIEGKQEKHQVTGGYIGNGAHKISLELLNAEIENLKHEGFEVVRTTSPEHSMFELSRWTQRIAKDVEAGKITACLTYQEFLEKCKAISKETDFSRLAKHAYQERMKEESNCQSPSGITPLDDSPTINDSLKRRLSYSEQIRTEDSKPKAMKTDVTSHSKATTIKRSFNFGSQGKVVHYSSLTTTALKQECDKYGFPKSGSRDAMIAKLIGPKPPNVWLKRKLRKEYVPPRHNVAGTAILVAMFLLHEEQPDSTDFSKEEIYVKAEALNIKKNPFSGGTTQTGPYHYDGWSSMKELLKGDPPLVTKNKNRFRLTRACEISGYPLAAAMHKWCHEHNNCSCQDLL